MNSLSDSAYGLITLGIFSFERQDWVDRGVVTYDRVRNAVFIPLSTYVLHSRLEAKLSALTYTLVHIRCLILS